MNVRGKFEFIGTKQMDGQGKNVGKKFYNVTLMQDTEVIELFADEKVFNKAAALRRLEVITCDIRVTKRQDKTYINLLDVSRTA
jgi:hypothetical protein